MGGFEVCWTYLVQFLNFLTITPFQRSFGNGLQRPLSNLPLSPEVVDYPIFDPPNGPENRPFRCEYPSMRDYELCSKHDDRGCWLRPKNKNSKKPTYGIHTDYENAFPKGITRKYTVDITNETQYPDGCENNEMKLFNATYPGPWIEACWGDDIEVTVRNHLPCNGTSIHWHGLRQLNNLEYDGVNAITQCPIAPGDSYTYKFHTRQYGTTWYHSHYSLQYGDGVVGPLTIHGPSSAGYDAAKDPILMTDWNQRSAFEDWAWSLEPDANGNFPRPLMTSILLNGKGIAPQGITTCPERRPSQLHEMVFQKGVRYLLRLINTSVDTTFIFTIDGHMMKVVEADFVPIKPYNTESVLVGIGQRYHVIVEALPHETTPDGNYWMRTVPAIGCSAFKIPWTAANATTGIVRYDPRSTADPTSKVHEIPTRCSDEPYESLIPILEWNVLDMDKSEDMNITRVPANTDPYYPQYPDNSTFRRWQMYKGPLWLNFSDPTILNPDGSTSVFESQYQVQTSVEAGEQWIELLITGPGNVSFAAHPIHLHGHDFALLSQDDVPFNESTAVIKRDNPPRRDVALLPQNGYLLIAFKVDNPGTWLVHCHIAWHASSGLAMQILENTDRIVFHEKNKLLRTCRNWDKWYGTERLTNPICNRYNQEHFQDDSGI